MTLQLSSSGCAKCRQRASVCSETPRGVIVDSRSPTLSEAADRLRAGTVTSVALTQQSIRRAAAVDSSREGRR
jgi:hypothetical protein